MEYFFIWKSLISVLQYKLDRLFSPQYRSVKPKNLGKDAKFRVSTGLKSVPQILN
ncbi:hypothetical protein GXM_05711 [Nostoc sphaeroides CCNUC1]|uniref:Uncharacterized protein n=1 Tax=Nostoc sphaeroides CCNUC1 TaxID=2653204 RepID=A0A5P8W8D7_9NOSO|nr:hypothetical protein GXM_05711 [Nostoc sphaeroides CCNUC1]